MVRSGVTLLLPLSQYLVCVLKPLLKLGIGTLRHFKHTHHDLFLFSIYENDCFFLGVDEKFGFVFKSELQKLV